MSEKFRRTETGGVVNEDDDGFRRHQMQRQRAKELKELKDEVKELHEEIDEIKERLRRIESDGKEA